MSLRTILLLAVCASAVACRNNRPTSAGDAPDTTKEQWHLAFVSAPTQVMAGQPFEVTVEVLDESSTRVQDADATLSLSLESAPDLLMGATSLAPASGLATFGELTIQRAGTWRLRASVPGVAPLLSAPFEVAPAAMDASVSTLSASTTAVVADGTATATLSLRVADAFDNGLPNVPVELTVSGEQNTLSATSGTTDAQGNFTATLSSTRAERKSVTAAVGAAALGPVPVTFIAGAVQTFELDVTPSEIPADGSSSSEVSVRALDEHGNAVPGATLALTVTGADNAVTPATAITNEAGEATVTVRGSTSGDHVVSVSDGILTATAGLTMTPAPAAVDTLASAGGAGCLELDYRLRQSEAMRADVRVEYELNGTWHRATQAGAETGSGLRSLSTSAAGTPHTFHWNSSRDLPLFSGTVAVRVVASTTGTADGLSSSIDVQVGNGLAFGAPATVSLGAQVPAAILHTDIDRDGDVDFLVPGSDPSGVTLILGAAEELTVSETLSTPGYTPAYVVTADFDRDGALDIVMAGRATDRADLYFASSPGVFGSEGSSSITFGGNARGLASGDFNRNGTIDILGLTEAGTLEVFARQTGSSFTFIGGAATGGPANALATGDLDGDGDTDAIVATASGLSLWKNGAGPSYFSLIATHTITGGASRAAVADFDRDGWLDVAALHAGSAEVSLVFGSSSGISKSSTTALTEVGAGLVPADVDSDGDVDLLVSHAHGIALLLNDGSGALAPSSPVSVSSAGALTAVDVDHDGRVEIVAARPASFDIVVLPNDTPAPCQPSLAGTRMLATADQPASVVIEDFDLDGRLDLAFSESGAGTVSLRRGRGDGTFAPMDTLSVGLQPQQLVKADLDADGVVDLLTANQGDSTVTVLLSSGTGFSAGSHPAGPGAHRLVVGRFDDDDHADVITLNAADETMTLLPGDGQGALGAAVLLHTFSGAVRGIAAGDYDADGDLDVAAISGPSAVLMKNDGSSAFVVDRSISVGTGPESIAFAHMDDDGWLDLVASSGQTFVTVALGSASGTFTSKSYYGADILTAISVVDLEGDGDLDVLGVGSIAAGNQRGRMLTRFLNDGKGVLGAGARFAAGYGLVALDVADLDGDGALDVSAANRDLDRISIIPGDGAGGFLEPHTSPTAATPGHTLTDLTLADLDHDGRADAVSSVSGSAALGVQLGLPGGGFGPVTLFSVGATTQDFALADFNHDGHLDAAVGTNSSFSLVLGNGAGGFGSPSNPLAVGAIGAVAAADFDRDGHVDVAVVTNAASITLYYGAGNGTFPSGVSVGSDSGAWDLLAADVDRDGWTDLVVPAKSANYVAVHWNPRGRGNGFTKSTVSMGASSGPTKVVLADVDRDGWPDLVSSNGGSQPGASWARVEPTALTFMERWTTANGSEDLAAADIDGDGAVEIVLPDTGNRRLTVIDTGTGEVNDWAVSLEPRAVSVQDDDGDGLCDILSAGFSALSRLAGR